MPARADLSGRRFGNLTVIHLTEYAPKSRAKWLCRCDCGETEEFKQYQLTGHRVDRCHSCSRKCVICGQSVPKERGQRNTCSVDCERAKKLDIQNSSYHRRMQDPDRGEQIRKDRVVREQKRIADLSADQKKEREKQRYLRRKAREAKNPALIAKREQGARERYREHATAIQLSRRERVEKMDATEFANFIAKRREYDREWRREWRKSLHEDPALYAIYMEKMREHRRQRALKKLIAEGSQLQKGPLNDDN